jgi:plasmid stability protein
MQIGRFSRRFRERPPVIVRDSCDGNDYIAVMATLTVRNLPQSVHDALRRIAAENRSSLEAEVRAALAEHVARKASPDDIKRRLSAIQATLPKPAPSSKTDGVDAFLAGKRLEVLFEEGLISLNERTDWEDRVERGDVSLREIEALFDRLWPWPKRST